MMAAPCGESRRVYTQTVRLSTVTLAYVTLINVYMYFHPALLYPVVGIFTNYARAFLDRTYPFTTLHQPLSTHRSIYVSILCAAQTGGGRQKFRQRNVCEVAMYIIISIYRRSSKKHLIIQIYVLTIHCTTHPLLPHLSRPHMLQLPSQVPAMWRQGLQKGCCIRRSGG